MDQLFLNALHRLLCREAELAEGMLHRCHERGDNVKVGYYTGKIEAFRMVQSLLME